MLAIVMCVMCFSSITFTSSDPKPKTFVVQDPARQLMFSEEKQSSLTTSNIVLFLLGLISIGLMILNWQTRAQMADFFKRCSKWVRITKDKVIKFKSN